MELAGKYALVTGSGQGVGRAIALELASRGATVAINDIVAERVTAVVAEIENLGGRAISAMFDVTSIDAVYAAVAELPAVDILINNAGNSGAEPWTGMHPFHESDPTTWDRYIRINLYGVMNGIRAVLPGMIERARGGRVVTIVSDAARYGDANLAVYAAGKAGAAGLTRSVAREVGRYEITVNNVALGTIRPPDSTVPDEELVKTDPVIKKRIGAYVIRRRGEPEDVAAMVAFLASPGAEWITGQTYPVNGGYSFAL